MKYTVKKSYFKYMLTTFFLYLNTARVSRITVNNVDYVYLQYGAVQAQTLRITY